MSTPPRKLLFATVFSNSNAKAADVTFGSVSEPETEMFTDSITYDPTLLELVRNEGGETDNYKSTGNTVFVSTYKWNSSTNSHDFQGIQASNPVTHNLYNSLFNSEVHQNLKSIHRILQKEFDSQDIF